MTDFYNENTRRPIRRQSTRRPKRRMKKSGVIIILVALLVIVLGGGIYFGTAFGAQNLDAEVRVEIPEGSGAKQIGNILEENDVVKHKWAFVFQVRKSGTADELQPGTYAFGPGKVSLSEIVESMTSGGSIDNANNVTIPEGYTVEQIADTLAAGGFVDKQAFLAAAGAYDTSAYSYIPQGDSHIKLEGFLYPETYNISKEWGPDEIIGMMLAQFDKVFTEDMRNRAYAMGYSIYEIVTMASLVEREALFDDERPTVAGVFYNRLDIGMRLQSCASVQYILGEQKPVLTESDIAIDNPYNTYLYEGLTPGPIASPGLSSLNAALYPEDTDYMYFVAKPDGHHHFSTTHEEHVQAKNQYL